MSIKPQLTGELIAWRLKKIACNLLPSKKLRKKLKKSMPQKWDVIRFSEQNMQKYQEIVDRYADVLTPAETLEAAIQTPSFSRIGDGEFNIIIGIRNSFNNPNAKLAQRLKEICEKASNSHCLVCLNNYKLEKDHPCYSWFLHHGTRRLDKIVDEVNFASQEYGDAYFLVRETERNGKFDETGLKKIQKLWNSQKVLFVCNRHSPIIKDNLKFFEQISQKEFLYIPDQDAFDHYNELLADIKKYDTSWRIYMEAGATASVLAWDLSQDGYHAFDMGDFYKRSEALINNS